LRKYYITFVTSTTFANVIVRARAFLAYCRLRKSIHLFREWTADQLVALVRNPHVPKHEGWVMSIMRFLLLHGFYRQRQVSKVRTWLDASDFPVPLMHPIFGACSNNAVDSNVIFFEAASWVLACRGDITMEDLKLALDIVGGGLLIVCPCCRRYVWA
jgi:hypothetical protein